MFGEQKSNTQIRVSMTDMAANHLSAAGNSPSLAVGSSSTIMPQAPWPSSSALPGGPIQEQRPGDSISIAEKKSAAEAEMSESKGGLETSSPGNSENQFSTIYTNNKKSLKVRAQQLFGPSGKLRPFRLLKQDIGNIKKRYLSDWTTFNQLVFASAVYVFFTNILPGITFASDLFVLTGKTWGTIEVVFSTGLCGVIFSM
jgi:hypothetical protein